MKSKVKKFSFGMIFIYILVMLAILVAVYPLIWTIISSLKTDWDFMSNRMGLPAQITFDNYIQAWKKGDFPLYFKNSVIVSSVSLVVMIGTASMAAFAFARYKFAISKHLLNYFLIGQMLSAQLVLVAVYLVLVMCGLDNTKTGLSLVYAASGLPFTVFLLQGFFRSLPGELFESAEIDGCTEGGIFLKIALPLCKPGLSAALIVQFMYVWNEFSLSLVSIRTPANITLPVGLYKVIFDMYFSSRTLACAGLIIAALPVLIIYILFQRQIMSGMTAGALKG